MDNLQNISGMTVLGWRELVLLPDLSNTILRAKVDTGARTSSLHVERQWRLTENGAPFVGFEIKPRRSNPKTIQGILPIIDERVVSDSGGHRLTRPFVMVDIEVAGVLKTVEMNLANRQNMLFPMLLGRSALSGFLVDGDRSFLHGKQKTR